MNRNGELKTIGVIADNTLGNGGLQEMGFYIPKTNLKPRHVCLRLAGKASRTAFYI